MSHMWDLIIILCCIVIFLSAGYLLVRILAKYGTHLAILLAVVCLLVVGIPLGSMFDWPITLAVLAVATAFFTAMWMIFYLVAKVTHNQARMELHLSRVPYWLVSGFVITVGALIGHVFLSGKL